MYSFSERFKRAAIIPIVFIVVATARFVWLLANNQTLWPPQTNVFIDLVQQYVAIIIGYVVSVLFFSVEALVKVLMNKQTTMQTLVKRIRHRSVGANLETAEKWDTKDTYKLTNSIIFQSVIMVIALYASIISSSLTGQVVILSVLLQMFIEQGITLLRGGDLSVWYWQVTSREYIKRDTHILVFVLMALFFTQIVWMALF